MGMVYQEIKYFVNVYFSVSFKYFSTRTAIPATIWGYDHMPIELVCMYHIT